MTAKVSTQPPIDPISALCRDMGVDCDPGDGVLLIRCDSSGNIYPHVLRLGILTEGRIEQQLMLIFRRVMETRMREGNRIMREQRRQPQLMEQNDDA